MQSRRERGASHQPPVAFFEEEARDILAVLEAAQAFKDADVRQREDSGSPAWIRYMLKRDALLALIDLSDDLRVLGGTK